MLDEGGMVDSRRHARKGPIRLPPRIELVDLVERQEVPVAQCQPRPDVDATPLPAALTSSRAFGYDSASCQRPVLGRRIVRKPDGSEARLAWAYFCQAEDRSQRE